MGGSTSDNGDTLFLMCKLAGVDGLLLKGENASNDGDHGTDLAEVDDLLLKRERESTGDDGDVGAA